MARESEQSPRGRRHDRHRSGSAGTALIVVDMLNPYRHFEAERLAAHVSDALPGIRTLLSRAAEVDLPIVYVNDNYGDWNSSAESWPRMPWAAPIRSL